MAGLRDKERGNVTKRVNQSSEERLVAMLRLNTVVWAQVVIRPHIGCRLTTLMSLPPPTSPSTIPDWSVLTIHMNGGQWYGHWWKTEEEKRRQGRRSIVRSGGQLPRGKEYARPTSAPSLPSPNLTPLLRRFRWSFYHPAGYNYMDFMAVN